MSNIPSETTAGPMLAVYDVPFLAGVYDDAGINFGHARMLKSQETLESNMRVAERIIRALKASAEFPVLEVADPTQNLPGVLMQLETLSFDDVTRRSLLLPSLRNFTPRTSYEATVGVKSPYRNARNMYRMLGGLSLVGRYTASSLSAEISAVSLAQPGVRMNREVAGHDVIGDAEVPILVAMVDDYLGKMLD